MMVTQPPAIDSYGYSRYGVVLMLPEEEQRKVDAIRIQLTIPIPMLPAHVTVKGSFDSITSLEDIKLRMAQIARLTRPFIVRLGELQVWKTATVIKVEKSPVLESLNDKLWEAIGSISRNVYGVEDRGKNYNPHMTIYQEVDEETHKLGLELARELKIKLEFTAREMHLVGLAGLCEAGKGHWQVIALFPFEMID